VADVLGGQVYPQHRRPCNRVFGAGWQSSPRPTVGLWDPDHGTAAEPRSRRIRCRPGQASCVQARATGDRSRRPSACPRRSHDGYPELGLIKLAGSSCRPPINAQVKTWNAALSPGRQMSNRSIPATMAWSAIPCCRIHDNVVLSRR
jgi:hypothetical protein